LARNISLKSDGLFVIEKGEVLEDCLWQFLFFPWLWDERLGDEWNFLNFKI